MVGTLAEPMKALLDVSQVANVIEKGVNTFMEAVPVLVKMLDEVAKVHPFISGELRPSTSGSKCDRGMRTVAVIAFKAVYTLEVIRQENDKKILALYAEHVCNCYREFIQSHRRQDERYDGSPYSVSFLRSL